MAYTLARPFLQPWIIQLPWMRSVENALAFLSAPCLGEVRRDPGACLLPRARFRHEHLCMNAAFAHVFRPRRRVQLRLRRPVHVLVVDCISFSSGAATLALPGNVWFGVGNVRAPVWGGFARCLYQQLSPAAQPRSRRHTYRWEKRKGTPPSRPDEPQRSRCAAIPA